MRLPVFIAVLATLVLHPISCASDDEFREKRVRLMAEIQADARFAAGALGRRSIDPNVMEAMRKVPRHEFVPPLLKSHAYANRPLPIGDGQTISQPFIVALMTDLLAIRKEDVILEIGTGSGYQAAVLAELAKKVHTIEIIRDLGERARDRLSRLGYRNIEVRIGDGYFGWEEHAPFDAIIVTAAAGHVPPPLIGQLKPGGRIVIPVGGAYQVQMLIIVTKDAAGAISTKQVIPVSFVPMTGRAQKAE